MANKKRVEEEMPNMENVKINITPEEHKVEIPKNVKEDYTEVYKPQKNDKQETPVVNCLRNETIIVRFIPSPSAMVRSKGHVLSGGMADTATRSFVVPRLSSGQYKNVLTNNEMKFLEKYMIII